MAGLKQIMEIFMTINQPLSSEQRVRWYIQTDKGTEHYESDDIGNSLLAILKHYQEKNTMIQDIQVDRGSLEQHFLKIAKGE